MNVLAKSSRAAFAASTRSAAPRGVAAFRSPRVVVRMASTQDTQGTEKKLDRSTSEDVWKTILNAEEYRILRQKGTEPAGSGKYNKVYDEGTYVCTGCGAPLYKSETKFNSGCGWPAFYDEIPGSVERIVDEAYGMKRTEIVCKNCGGHLGHVFEGEGFPTPTNQRHCVNSVSVKLKPGKE